MKRYNTLEIIDILYKNKNLKATNGLKIGTTGIDKDGRDFIVISNVIGFKFDKLCWLKPNGDYFCDFTINKEVIEDFSWRLIQETVSFIEAANSNHRIKPAEINDTYIETSLNNFQYIDKVLYDLSQFGCSEIWDYINTIKWYIEIE